MAACGCISTLGLWVLASTIVGFFALFSAAFDAARSDAGSAGCSALLMPLRMKL